MDYPISPPGGYPPWLADPRTQVVLDLVLSALEQTALGLAHLDRHQARAVIAAARDRVLDYVEQHTVDLPAFAQDQDGEVGVMSEFLLARTLGRLLAMLDEADLNDAERQS